MHTRGQVHARSEEAKRRCYLLERRRGGGRAATARCTDAEPAVPIPWEGRSEGEVEGEGESDGAEEVAGWHQSLEISPSSEAPSGNDGAEGERGAKPLEPQTAACAWVGVTDGVRVGASERQHGEDKGEGESERRACCTSLTSRGETRGAPLNDAPPRRAAADAGSAAGWSIAGGEACKAVCATAQPRPAPQEEEEVRGSARAAARTALPPSATCGPDVVVDGGCMARMVVGRTRCGLEVHETHECGESARKIGSRPAERTQAEAEAAECGCDADEAGRDGDGRMPMARRLAAMAAGSEGLVYPTLEPPKVGGSCWARRRSDASASRHETAVVLVEHERCDSDLADAECGDPER